LVQAESACRDIFRFAYPPVNNDEFLELLILVDDGEVHPEAPQPCDQGAPDCPAGETLTAASSS
jgi:hypothetical protein